MTPCAPMRTGSRNASLGDAGHSVSDPSAELRVGQHADAELKPTRARLIALPLASLCERIAERIARLWVLAGRGPHNPNRHITPLMESFP